MIGQGQYRNAVASGLWCISTLEYRANELNPTLSRCGTDLFQVRHFDSEAKSE